jgi:hypothetical protein
MVVGLRAGHGWVFEDPIVRKIRSDLHEAGHQYRREIFTKIAVGTGAATSTFFAGVKILNLSAILWQTTHLNLLEPLLSALTAP